MKSKSKDYKNYSSSKIMEEIKKEINAMHKATAEFVGVCIDIAKMHPKGINRIKKHVNAIVDNISKMDKMLLKSK